MYDLGARIEAAHAVLQRFGSTLRRGEGPYVIERGEYDCSNDELTLGWHFHNGAVVAESKRAWGEYFLLLSDHYRIRGDDRIRSIWKILDHKFDREIIIKDVTFHKGYPAGSVNNSNSRNNKTMDKKFWMVLGRSNPTYQHGTEEGARKEAKRLAQMHPGERFTVLEAIGSVVKQDTLWTDYRTEESGPF